MNHATRVIVVDDQTVVREGLVMLLGLLAGVEVVGSAADGATALELVARERPDVALMDLRMPVVDGVEATRRITADHPETRVVILTTYADDASILAAIRAGARGYLTKDAGAEELRAAIERVQSGETTLEPRVQARLLDALATPAHGGAASERGAGPPAPGSAADADPLTPREREVLGLMAQGLSNQELARRLFVSEATVKTHINNLFSKLGVRDRGQAIAYAYRHGLAGRS